MPCAPGCPASLLAAVLLLLLSGCARMSPDVTWTLPGPSTPVTSEQPDVSTGPPTPHLHLKFDPRTMRLSWNCPEDSRSARCFMSHTEEGHIVTKPGPGRCECTFRHVPLHRGVTLRVSVATAQGTAQEELLYANPGAAGSAAHNFSCVIYRARFMNCSWARGPAAPGDVQYYLFIGDSKRTTETECPHYVQDSGTHSGCHLRDLSGLKFRNFFLVNGSSREAGIQFFDWIRSTKEIEQISPPDNVTVSCNASHCLIQWTQPTTRTAMSYLDFQYQLGIQTQNPEARSYNPVINVSGQVHNLYTLPSPEPSAKHTLRIRAADSRGGQWGDWSGPVEFGPRGQEAGLLHVYLLVVLGTLVCALALGFLFSRFHGMSRLFPPIPQVKDKVNLNDQVDHQVDWAGVAPGAGKEDHEDILTVEKVS